MNLKILKQKILYFFIMGHPVKIDERDFENMNPTVVKWTITIALAAPLVFFALKLIHL